MNVLILGSGSREHAFAWKIKQSPICTGLFILPGNGGTAELGTNINESPKDFPAIKKWVLELQIGMVLVGPEEPLILGIRDFFLNDPELSQVYLIGPTKASAQLEGSKDFSKRFMQRNSIPTAPYKTFNRNTISEGLEYLRHHSLPIVLKADGLAAGKGVIICETLKEAEENFLNILERGAFGKSGDKVVVEGFLKGIEMSLFILTDGKSYKILPEAKDYKRIGEGDTGLNTGGMGSVSPVPFFTEELKNKINETIILPTLDGLKEEGLEYYGFLFIGLMIQGNDPYVIEYNVRMGDPETQSVLPRMEVDLLELLLAVGDQKLDSVRMYTNPQFATTVVSVSGGYPGEFNKGYPIEITRIPDDPDTFFFHGGTQVEDGVLRTSGGRVISTTSLGNTLQEALKKANSACSSIEFSRKYFRKDIGNDLWNL